MDKSTLTDRVQQHFGEKLKQATIKDMVTLELAPQHLLEVSTVLRDHADFHFEILLDVCGVDYLDYGVSEWRTEETTLSGFSRGKSVAEKNVEFPWGDYRYAAVYHLLSIKHNHRIRLKVYLPPEPIVPSVIDIWASANWYEREAFDLFGIVFDGHPDLRRLLTDYGFKGHPFRKDFPLIGEVELRYDAATGRCVYEPVSIQTRINIPKTIRRDSRYIHLDNEEGAPNHG